MRKSTEIKPKANITFNVIIYNIFNLKVLKFL